MAAVSWSEGDVVRKLRAAVGWKLKHLSAASGVPMQVIHRLEIGKTKEAKRGTLAKIAAAFGLTSRQLQDSVPPTLDLPVVVREVPRLRAGQKSVAIKRG